MKVEAEIVKKEKQKNKSALYLLRFQILISFITLILFIIYICDSNSKKEDPLLPIVETSNEITGYKMFLLGQNYEKSDIDKKELKKSFKEEYEMGIFRITENYSKKENVEELSFREEQQVVWVESLPHSKLIHTVKVGNYFKSNEEEKCKKFYKNMHIALEEKYGTFIIPENQVHDKLLEHTRKNNKEIDLIKACSDKRAVFVNFYDLNLRNNIDKENVKVLKMNF